MFPGARRPYGSALFSPPGTADEASAPSTTRARRSIRGCYGRHPEQLLAHTVFYDLRRPCGIESWRGGHQPSCVRGGARRFEAMLPHLLEGLSPRRLATAINRFDDMCRGCLAESTSTTDLGKPAFTRFSGRCRHAPAFARAWAGARFLDALSMRVLSSRRIGGERSRRPDEPRGGRRLPECSSCAADGHELASRWACSACGGQRSARRFRVLARVAEAACVFCRAPCANRGCDGRVSGS